jgi:beta-lysine 5,6-aminomutase alpha subunit
MRRKLTLDDGLIAACHQAASQVAGQVGQVIRAKTTFAVERTVVRLLGVDGVDERDVPLANVVVDHLAKRKVLEKGTAYWLGNALIATGQSAQTIAELLGRRQIDLTTLPLAPREAIAERVAAESRRAVADIQRRRSQRRSFREGLRESATPLIYVLTATGNVYEDVVHASAVADNGGDIVAVIRSTAQSLYDYVPYGPTTEGFGGTFATQANFRIMRQALDEWSSKNGRYVRLSSFCSGLCMPEIAAMGALERLDMMLNDSMYGILFRDINMYRTLIDQHFSRMINGYFGIVINTGEDNYLRTADAVTSAPAVVASQMINYHVARLSGVPTEQIAVGSAFEIQPELTNGFLLEVAHAQLTRELFPDCPVKFMPPTRFMDGNLLRTHACDTLFNLVTKMTGQGIQTLGVPTEGVFTPHIQDRVHGLESARYVFNFARDFGDEIEFKADGIIQSRAGEVLRSAAELLRQIAERGLFWAIEARTFGGVSRKPDDGKGAEGIVAVDPDWYFNPFIQIMGRASDA